MQVEWHLAALERCSSYKKRVSAFLQLGWHSPTAMGAEVPGTPETEESIEPENPIEPEQVITGTMSTTATEQNASNRKGEKCCTPKDFDGNEAKYKTWLRMTETDRKSTRLNSSH